MESLGIVLYLEWKGTYSKSLNALTAKEFRLKKNDKNKRGGSSIFYYFFMVEGDLEITQNNMGIFSEMLTDLTPGKEHPEVTISII